MSQVPTNVSSSCSMRSSLGSSGCTRRANLSRKRLRIGQAGGKFRAFAAMRNSLQLSPVRDLLAIALILGLTGGAAAAGQVPCRLAARRPYPDYAAVDAAPAVQVISGKDLAAWKPAPCVGWQAKDDGVLVALAGRFHFSGHDRRAAQALRRHLLAEGPAILVGDRRRLAHADRQRLGARSRPTRAIRAPTSPSPR